MGVFSREPKFKSAYFSSRTGVGIAKPGPSTHTIMLLGGHWSDSTEELDSFDVRVNVLRDQNKAKMWQLFEPVRLKYVAKVELWITRVEVAIPAIEDLTGSAWISLHIPARHYFPTDSATLELPHTLCRITK